MTRSDSLRIVFMGTPEFAVPSLQQLVSAGYPPVAVVTGPDRRRGRGRKLQASPVKKAAQELGIETLLQPESVKDPEFARQVADLRPDVIVVVAFRILPPAVFESAALGAFNLHGSLLPKYRGAAPIHHAVLSGDAETGVTTFFLKEKVDTGHVIMQRPMDIGPDETTGDVYTRMMHLGAEVVVETVRAIEADRVEEVPQVDELATPAPKVRVPDAQIDWTQPAAVVHNTIRAYSPIPGAWTMLGDRRLKILRSQLPGGESEAEHTERTVGELVVADGPAGQSVAVRCADGLVELVEVQLEGRRAMPARDFVAGLRKRSALILG